MDEPGMNPKYGKKWFFFFTKVRPFLAGLSFFFPLLDFLTNISLYLSFWWMTLAFVGGVAEVVLSIMVFIKSQGDYVKFVRFVKGVLLFETFSIAYHQGVLQYINSGFDWDYGLVAFLFAAVLAFFLWYLPNTRYFKKRIHHSAATPETNLPSDTQNSFSYCMNCGHKLSKGSNFCGKCGAPVFRG